MGNISRDLIALFEPQVEQLGITLERQGGIWAGRASGSAAEGTMWLCAPAPHCLVLCHDVSPLEDMPLFEGSQGPYACACMLDDDAIDCSQDCGLPMRFIGSRSRGRAAREALATFVEREPRSLSSHLRAGHAYRSRSIILLPEFFDELDRHYSGAFHELFPLFDAKWNRGSEHAIGSAIGSIPVNPPSKPGSELGLLSTITSLIAKLAAQRATVEDEDAETLAQRAQDLVSGAIEAGAAPPSIDDVAKQLYISRSRLCELFKRETGQSVGAYGRRLRLERAYRLLGDGNLSVAEVAGLLGYPSPSAFCHAFAAATGMAPRAWQKANRSATWGDCAR